MKRPASRLPPLVRRHAIHAENGQPVEYGELLFELEPILAPPAV